MSPFKPKADIAAAAALRGFWATLREGSQSGEPDLTLLRPQDRQRDQQYAERVREELRHAQAFASAPLRERLEHVCHELDPFQALRRLEAESPPGEFPRIGWSQSCKADLVHLGQRPYLTFAPRNIDGWFPAGVDSCRFPKRPVLLLFAFGLLGPSGPLPRHLTEYALDREREDDYTLSNFLNVLQHRMLCFYYRCWTATRPITDFDRPGPQRITRLAGSIVGVGSPESARRSPHLAPHYATATCVGTGGKTTASQTTARSGEAAENLETEDWPRLFYAGWLAKPQRCADGLESLLRGYFRVPVEVLPFLGRWIELRPEELSRLRLDSGAVLGTTAVLGSRIRDCQTKFRIRLGPLVWDDLVRFLPGSLSGRRLRELVEDYVGWEFDWDLQLVLSKEAVPELALDGSRRLGWTTFLGSSPLFSVDDLTDLASLADSLKGRSRPLDAWVADRLSSETKVALAGYRGADSDPARLQTSLRKDLNRLVLGPSMHDEQRFAGMTLRSETEQLLSKNPRGNKLATLNRLLLEDAYPSELARNSLRDADRIFFDADKLRPTRVSLAGIEDLPSLVSKLVNHTAPIPSSPVTADRPEPTAKAPRRRDYAVSAYLWDRLSPSTRQALLDVVEGQPIASATETALLLDLTKVCQGELIFDTERFKEVNLRRETWDLIDRRPQGADLVRLNRMLLEDTYRREFARIPQPPETHG